MCFIKPVIHIKWIYYLCIIIINIIIMLMFSLVCVFLVFGHNETGRFEEPSPHRLAMQLVQSLEIAVSILVAHHFQSL